MAAEKARTSTSAPSAPESGRFATSGVRIKTRCVRDDPISVVYVMVARTHRRQTPVAASPTCSWVASKLQMGNFRLVEISHLSRPVCFRLGCSMEYKV